MSTEQTGVNAPTSEEPTPDEHAPRGSRRAIRQAERAAERAADAVVNMHSGTYPSAEREPRDNREWPVTH